MKTLRGILTLLLVPVWGFAQTDYYVDASRTANGDGSEADPWKLESDINWTTVNTALGSGPVNIYFSSRDTWTDGGNWFPPAGSNGTASNPLKLIGDEKYNTVDSGAASWQTETVAWDPVTATGNMAYNNGGANFDGKDDRTYITIKGFHMEPTWQGVVFTEAEITGTNNITMENLWIDKTNSAQGQGIYFGASRTGCSDMVTKNCRVQGTATEAIYMGDFEHNVQEITGVIVEGNVVIDCGLSGEGEIDIKPPCLNAIVRNNLIYRTSGTTSGATAGIATYADGTQIYGNTIHHTDTGAGGPNDWGNGIFVTSAGDAVSFTQAITNCKVYNNFIYVAGQDGIRVIAGRTGEDGNIAGLEIYNNTIVGSLDSGIQFQRLGASTITSSTVKNNILMDSGTFDIEIGPGTITLTIDYNMYHRTSGNSWSNNGSVNWTTWQGAGYDANGIENTDPGLVDDTSYTPDLHLSLVTSAAVGAAEELNTEFTTDFDGDVRGAAWDIGADEFSSGAVVGDGTVSGNATVTGTITIGP